MEPNPLPNARSSGSGNYNGSSFYHQTLSQFSTAATDDSLRQGISLSTSQTFLSTLSWKSRAYSSVEASGTKRLLRCAGASYGYRVDLAGFHYTCVHGRVPLSRRRAL
jgi:hypothetical protein